MTVGDRQYNEADLLQMQREAEERVREMQARARKQVAEDNQQGFHPRNRNWYPGSGFNQNRGRRPAPQNRPQRGGTSAQRSPRENPEPQAEPRPAEEESRQASPPPPEPRKDSTVIGDIMGALGLDEDYLLIVGLILILLNQRADTTLILALAYLLI